MKKPKSTKKLVNSLMAGIMITATCNITLPTLADDISQDTPYIRENAETYRKYMEAYSGTKRPPVEIIIEGELYEGTRNNAKIFKSVYKESEALIWEEYGGVVRWKINVEESGFYNISIKHASIDEGINPSEIKLSINGKVPFESANYIKLSKLWKDETKIKQDERGNDLKPRQVASLEWTETILHDTDGIYNEPYLFYLEKGENTIEVEIQDANIAIDYIKIYNEPQVEPYKQWYENEKPEPTKNSYINIIEAENNAIYKSDSTLSPTYDRSSPITSPQHPVNLRYNIMGGNNWKYTGQWISWEFEVEEAGYYQIGMRARQNIRNGMTSYRRVYIDGKVPYEELMNVEFPFDFDWYLKTLGNEEPFLFYLDKGKHEIKMEIVPGEMSEIYAALEQIIYELNECYRKIFMITGPSPDGLRDYMLEQQVPGLMNQINKSRTDIEKVRDRLIEIAGQKGSEVGVFDNLIAQLDGFIKEPDMIAKKISEFNNNIGSLASWMNQLKEQPIEIDYFYIKSEDAEEPKVNSNFIQNLWFNLQCIWASFTEDYSDSASNIEDSKEVLEVWIGVGRDQLNIVQELIDEYFTPQTGIEVNVSLVQRSILEPILAGKGPDVTLLTASSEVMNLAFRNAAVDLTQFEDFDSIRPWFQEEAFIPYQLEEEIYAVPLVQAFPMLFYRKDILEEMNINVPTTWDELHEANDILQKKYMQIGVPATMDTFGMMIYQTDGEFYTEDFKQTTFDTEESIESFIDWTDLYTKRGYPLSYDFYNRFRRGEMPLAVAPYTMYTMLEVAAPEIKGLWGMAPVVGTPQKDGSINNATTSSIKQGAMILKDAENKEDAWEFIKWFASPQVQAEFGIAVENLMGPLGRYSTANREAFEYLAWSKKEQDLILNQWDVLREIPEVPGNYYVTRQLDYAFRSVVNTFANPRHELNRYNQIINEEITRKRIDLKLD